MVPVEAKYQRNRWLCWDWFDVDCIDKHQLGLSGTLVRGERSIFSFQSNLLFWSFWKFEDIILFFSYITFVLLHWQRVFMFKF